MFNYKKIISPTVNIYWACLEPEWIRAEQPVPILSNFVKNIKMPETRMTQCPAIHDELHNLFGIKSIYDYEFTVDTEKAEVTSKVYDQAFYNRHVLLRSMKEKVFTFSQEFIFFTDEDSLKISGDLFPFLEDNNITERCIVYPGKFDIGKWYRPLEFAFKLKDSYNTFKIETGEIFQYMRIHTERTVKFIQFRETKKLNEILVDINNIRNNKKRVSPLNYYYEKFKLKKLIMKEIKDNLL